MKCQHCLEEMVLKEEFKDEEGQIHQIYVCRCGNAETD